MPGRRFAPCAPTAKILAALPLAPLALAALLLLPGCYARRPIPSGAPGDAAAIPAATPAVAPAPAPEAQPAPQAAAEPAAQPVAEAPAQQNATAPDAAKDTTRDYYAQIGSFTTEKNANGAVAWLKERGYSEVRIVRVEQGQAVYLRVQAGPFQGYAPARKALDELKKDWPQAFIPGD